MNGPTWRHTSKSSSMQPSLWTKDAPVDSPANDDKYILLFKQGQLYNITDYHHICSFTDLRLDMVKLHLGWPDVGGHLSVHKPREVKLLIIFGQNEYTFKRHLKITNVLWWVLGLCRESLGWAFHSLLTNLVRVNRSRDIKKRQR